MEDYTFYGIFAPKEGCIYIGKTTEYHKRSGQHRRESAYSKVKIYKLIREYRMRSLLVRSRRRGPADCGG